MVVGGGIQAGGVIFIDFFHGDHLIGFGPQLGGQGNLVPDLQRVELPKMVVDTPVVRCHRNISPPYGGILEVAGPLGQCLAVRTLIDLDRQVDGRDFQGGQIPALVVEIIRHLRVAGRGGGRVGDGHGASGTSGRYDT